MVDRRTRFREYMSRFDAAADPMRALDGGFYVRPPEESSRSQIAMRAELDPKASQLVVGGIGTGKTTALLVAADEIQKIDDTISSYVDVSRRHDLRKMGDGVLLVIAGLEIAKLIKVDSDAIRVAKEKIDELARGSSLYIPQQALNASDKVADSDTVHFGGEQISIPPILEPPLPGPSPRVMSIFEHLRSLRAAIPEHIVLLLDSLDRMTDIDRFKQVVHQDVRALKALGIGLVLVGPSRVLYGADRPITDVFDHTVNVPAVDIQSGYQAWPFLMSALRRRADEEILPDISCSHLAVASGGVLRDAMLLSRRAGEEAYMNGADVIEKAHVERAKDAFGRTLMLGLREPEIEKLCHLRWKGNFVPTNDEDIALIETRRVLEYPGPPLRFAVHPAMNELLEALAEQLE